MTINFEISEDNLKAMLDVFDPEHEVWNSVEDVQLEDARDMLGNIFRAWIEQK